MSSAPDRSSRATAARLLTVWLKRGVFPDDLLQPVREDRAFVTELVCGVVRWHRMLDAVRAQLAPRRPGPMMEAHLLVGLYQLLRLDVAPYAAVNETVSAARAVGGPRAANFGNACLRQALARADELKMRLAAEPPAVRLSHPDLLVQRWRAAWGEAATEALCGWNNEPPRVVLHLNAERVALADYLALLRARDVEAHPHPARPLSCVEVEGGSAVPALPGFAEGHFLVQDPSTLAAVDLVDARPGQRVLDVCAAPGGKTMAMAWSMRGEGLLLALDKDARRLRGVDENARRLGQGWIKTAAADLTAAHAAVPDLEPASFDAVLLDVPCTNTGVLRRRPDARWRFTGQRLAEAVARQRAILDAAAPFVRPGGRLVYSTCSLEAEENGLQVRAWLAAHPQFTLDAEQQLIPPASPTDGAYAARLIRQSSSTVV